VASPSTSGVLAVHGFGKASLESLLAVRGAGAIPAQARFDALARFEELPLTTILKGGRGWKRDLTKLDHSNVRAFEANDATLVPEVPASVAARGVIVSSLAVAARDHAAEFAAAFGTASDTRDDKFASLALAFQDAGFFVYVPAGVQIDEPLILNYAAGEAAYFPYTLIVLGEGARATAIERIKSAGGAPFVCGITEIVAGPRADLTYAAYQAANESDTTFVMTRRAALGSDAHAVERVRVTAGARGARADVTALFFANASQHVDVGSEVVHAAPATTSHTVVRSAGTGKGQGRYLGNIKILADAHGSDATLRDDALLLSADAHVDSVPALEIAANDVKAFHGATVGAISEDELFYAQSRGIPPEEAERMIALGFFEPAIARFPGEALREELRVALAAKLDGKAS
jgi:Fe-S cluster assembly protein SufD